ncbi:TetR/AcrR family transcriptional regulator [Amycolatopsis sp. NPDC059021]|uniref:TetR/AcrR family transcriptional regulator n=1 Tax=Amycolatopsis sp. NPDC059021 TaxID=3346704 RepID=UPI00366AF3F5
MTVPPPPWRNRPRRRAAKPALSQELIVKTALDILAAEGISAVTMRRVAQALETGPASLYAHVANKEELDELMLDSVLSDLPLPEPDPARWAGQVKELLGHQVRAMTAYPGIARVAWSIAIPVSPNMLRHGETMLALLRAGGLDLKQATYAADSLSLYAKAYAYEASSWTWGDFDQKDMAERSEQMEAYLQSLPPAMFPNTLRIGEFFNADTAGERFEFALDMFLAGLKALAAKNS